MYNRRTVIKGALATPLLWLGSTRGGRAEFAEDYGVASGEPRPDSVVLWTRVAPAFQTGGPVVVSYQVSPGEDFQVITASGQVETDSSRDYTVKVLVGGLAPFTRYYYRFSTTTGYQSVVGRTKTAPAPGSEPAVLRFAYVSCQDYTQGYYTVYAAMAADDLDFCVHLGDNIYETGAAGFQNGQVREDTIGGGEAISLAEYRQKYQLYLSDPDFREVRRLFPWIYLWDDHEVFNNYAGPELSAEERARQTAGYTAFLEYMPVAPVTPLVTVDGVTSVRLFRKLSFGSLIELYVLDERQYRDGVVCEQDFATLACRELDSRKRTMLGNEQKNWLKAQLSVSPVRWKVLLNEVMMMRFEAVNLDPRARFKNLPPASFGAPLADQGFYINLDAWDGYPAERTELLEFIRDEDIRNVVVWTGDIHNCYAGVLRPNFSDPNSPAVAVEVVGGSVSSAGVYELVGDIDLTALGTRVLQRANPHIQYLNLRYHVYTRVEVTPAAMQITYRAVESVTKTVASSFTLQTFTIPNNQASLSPA